MLSRVADSLYWMSRYLERAEHSARLIETHLNLIFHSYRAPANFNRRYTKVGLEQ